MTFINIQDPKKNNSKPGFALFALGFRPFFLFSGVTATIFLALWLVTYAGIYRLETYYGYIGWHRHEMLFGYGAAVIAGFLLTAVRNWTGIQTVRGAGLASLAGVWLLGRVLPFFADTIPPLFITVIDLAFLPALGLAVTIPIVQAKHYKSLIFLFVIALMWLGNILVHLEHLDITNNTASRGIYLAVNAIILAIVIIGGRVMPFFTEKALAGVVISPGKWIERLSVPSVLAFALVELFYPGSFLTGILAAVAALIHGLRLRTWYTHRIWSIPLLWVLFTGYAWMIAGFFLMFMASLNLISALPVLHAFTAGAIGVMTLGMMARVSLGHTGRMLQPARLIEMCFVVINLAVAIRVFLPVVFPHGYNAFVMISGVMWVVVFLIFTIIYTPILIQSRVDGQPG